MPSARTSIAKRSRPNLIKVVLITLSTQEALLLVKPLVDTYPDRSAPMYFCVNEGSQKQRKLVEILAGENIFELEWCVTTSEAEGGNLDAARQWLQI
jgi:hypothetical protein